MATVLVTGAGGEAVPALIAHLQGLGHRVIATDCDPNAVGAYLADGGYVVPRGGDATFADALHSVCDREGVDVVIPLVDEELPAALTLEQRGIHVLAPRPHFVALCADKLALARQLLRDTIRAALTWGGHQASPSNLAAAWGLRPILVKPRCGRGSRGVELIQSDEDFARYCRDQSTTPNCVVMQEYLPGDEYTVSVVCWRDGEVRAVVPKRCLSKKVATKIGVTRHHAEIDAICRRIQEKLRADGPFNVQFKCDAAGNPKVIEINPRFAGSSPLTLAAGVDEVGGLIDIATGKPYTFPDFREGVVMLRHASHTYIDEGEFAKRKPLAWNDD